MEILKTIEEVKNIKEGNSYKFQSGKNWFCIEYWGDDIQLRIWKEDMSNNITSKYFFRKTVKSIINVINKHF
ncbi:hypothetical protein V3471_15005 [Flavobacterium oreochromis]|uniref:hypothetical protein n=1 Tax=Flavobacterium oreochromis TaxID=2906078 RepID=UPI00385BD202